MEEQWSCGRLGKRPAGGVEEEKGVVCVHDTRGTKPGQVVQVSRELTQLFLQDSASDYKQLMFLLRLFTSKLSQTHPARQANALLSMLSVKTRTTLHVGERIPTCVCVF